MHCRFTIGLLFMFIYANCFAQCEDYSIQVYEESHCLPNTLFVLENNNMSNEEFHWNTSSNISDDQFLSNNDSLRVYVVGIEDTVAYQVYLEVTISNSITCRDTFNVKSFIPEIPVADSIVGELKSCNGVLNTNILLENQQDFQDLNWMYNSTLYDGYDLNLHLDDINFVQGDHLQLISLDANECIDTTSFEVEIGPERNDLELEVYVNPQEDCYDINSFYEISNQVTAINYNFDTTIIVDTVIVEDYIYPTSFYYNLSVDIEQCNIPFSFWHNHPGISDSLISFDFTTPGEQCSVFSFRPQQYNNDTFKDLYNYYWEITNSNGTIVGSSNYESNIFDIELEGTYDFFVQKSSKCGEYSRDTLYSNFFSVVGDYEIESSLDFLCIESNESYPLFIDNLPNQLLNDSSLYTWNVFRRYFSENGSPTSSFSSIYSPQVEYLERSIDSSRIQFNEPGAYTVEYSYTESDACSYTDNHTFNVGVKPQFIYPIANLNTYPYSNFPELCSGYDQATPFEFRSTSYLDITSNSTYLWSSTSNQVSIASPSDLETEITFNDAGNYQITLEVENSFGCIDSVTQLIEVGNTIANIKVTDNQTGEEVGDSICGPVWIDLTNTDTLNLDTLIGTIYSWKIIEKPIEGDYNPIDTTPIVSTYQSSIANNSQIPNPTITHYFQTHASVDVELVVESSYACYDTIYMEDYFNVIVPMPNFTVVPDLTDSPCDSMRFDIIDASNFVEEFTFVWLGDGVYSDAYEIGYTDSVNLEFPYINQNSDETYLNYRFFIYDAYYKGCTNNFDTLVTIYATPEVAMSISESYLCEDDTITFFDESIYSSSADTSASIFYWDFGDGTLSSHQNSNHVYTEAGTYTIAHHVTNGICTGDTIESSIDVYSNPEINFMVTDSIYCFGSEIEFENTSQLDSTVTSFESTWRFEVFDLENQYFSDSIGVFTPITNPLEQQIINANVSLYVIDNNGCSNSLATTNQFLVLDSILDIPSINYVSILNNDVLISLEESSDPYFNFFEIHQLNPQINEDTVLTTPLNEYFDSYPYEISSYFVKEVDVCLFKSDSSTIHSTIELNTFSSDYQKIQLDWSPYVGWDSIVSYDIFRSVENSYNFTLLSSVPGNQLSYLDSNMCNVAHGYYVVANSIDAEFTSRSNKSFQIPLYIDFSSPFDITSSVLNSTIVTQVNTNIYGNGYYFEVDRWDEYFGWQENYGLSDGNVFIDEDVSPSANKYKYRVKYADYCKNRGSVSNLSSNILLQIESLENQNILHWNQYEDWFQGVEKYEIKLLNTSSNEYETIAEIDAPSNSLDIVYIDESFIANNLDTNHCYQVEAHRFYSNNYSVSNESCVSTKLISYFPNAFTPNGDGINEFFKYYGTSAKSLEISIFSRFGKVVYSSDDIDFVWDGTDQYSGEKCSSGQYTLRYSMIDFNNNTVKNTQVLYLFY